MKEIFKALKFCKHSVTINNCLNTNLFKEFKNIKTNLVHLYLKISS